MHLRLAPGVHRLRSRASTAEALAHLALVGWSARVVDLTTVTDKAGVLDAFGAGLLFPEWVGRNWDALSDALRDLSWWQSGERGRAIIVAGAGRLDPGLEPDWHILCDILQEAADRWRTTPAPLGVLVRGRPVG
ncbi:MAG: barstar family protein [Chloroflexi bacterium]|nr:barstar family protein [Chloroflexota bacterium]